MLRCVLRKDNRMSKATIMILNSKVGTLRLIVFGIRYGRSSSQRGFSLLGNDNDSRTPPRRRKGLWYEC